MIVAPASTASEAQLILHYYSTPLCHNTITAVYHCSTSHTITQLLPSKVLLEDGWHMMTIPSVRPSTKPLNHLSQPPMNSDELRRAKAEDKKTKRQKNKKTKRQKVRKTKGQKDRKKKRGKGRWYLTQMDPPPHTHTHSKRGGHVILHRKNCESCPTQVTRKV